MRTLLRLSRITLFLGGFSLALYLSVVWFGHPFAGAPLKAYHYPGDSVLPTETELAWAWRACKWVFKFFLLLLPFTIPSVALEGVRSCGCCSRWRWSSATGSDKFLCRECAVGQALLDEDDRPPWLRFVWR
jgi:hypothetical protein